MDTPTSKRAIYTIIILGIIWCVSVLYRMFSEKKHSLDDETNIIIPTNNIITKSTFINSNWLPDICNKTVTILNCILNTAELSGEQESVNEYYQKTISERNTITDIPTLTSQCTDQYKYIQSITTWYQQVIQSCRQ